jgi:hypothetical protein
MTHDGDGDLGDLPPPGVMQANATPPANLVTRRRFFGDGDGDGDFRDLVTYDGRFDRRRRRFGDGDSGDGDGDGDLA